MQVSTHSRAAGMVHGADRAARQLATCLLLGAAPVLSLLSTSIWKRGCVLRLMRNREPSMFLRCCRARNRGRVPAAAVAAEPAKNL